MLLVNEQLGNLERNYHSFYQLLAGADNKRKADLKLGEASDYFYLNQKNTVLEIDGVNDAHDFDHVIAAMKMLNFSEVNFNFKVMENS